MRGFVRGFGIYAILVVALTVTAGAVSRDASIRDMFATYGEVDAIVFAVTAMQAGQVGRNLARPYMRRMLAAGAVIGAAMSVLMPILVAAGDPDVTIGETFRLASAETWLRSGLFAMAVAIFIALVGSLLGHIIDRVDAGAIHEGRGRQST